MVAGLIVIGAISTVLIVEGSKRENPSAVVWEERKWDGYAFNRFGKIFISDGVVYGGAVELGPPFSIEGQVIAVDIDNNELLWNHSHHGPSQHSIAIYSVFVSEGIVYSGDQHGNVTAADADTGEKIWSNSFHEGKYITRIESIHVCQGMIFTASRNGTVVCADTETGEKYWMHEHHNESVSSVHAEDGVVYSSSLDGNVTAADADTGEKIWNRELHDVSASSLHIQHGELYSGGYDELIAFDVEKEEILWSHSYHEGHVLSIHAENGFVYSGGRDGYVTAVDSSDGEKVWQHRYHTDNLKSSGWSFNDGIYSIQAVDGTIYSHCSKHYVLSVENEGGLKLGIFRAWIGFVRRVEDNLGAIFFILLIVIAIIGLIFGKPKHSVEESKIDNIP